VSVIHEDKARAADRLVARMSLDEKLACVSGEATLLRDGWREMRRYNSKPLVAAAVPRLGLKGLRFADGPRGVVVGRCTAFPVPMARAATFDPALEERVGDAIGVEVRSVGANLFGGVCINLLRHPAWGRAQETYGEDSHLLGLMGSALVRGVQRHALAVVKHFACNSVENSRFWLDVQIDEATLRDLYLPHFKACVDAGAAAVMTAYNKVNGEWCGEHSHLVGEILKGEWGFDGFVLSDFVWGVKDMNHALAAGQDLEMPFRRKAVRLRSLARRGKLDLARLDDAVERLVRAQLRLADMGEPERYGRNAIASEKHRALAREVGARSIVLLRNEDEVLPIAPADTRRVALIGDLAAARNTGDKGSSQVRPPHTVTIREGLLAARDLVLVDSCTDDLAAACTAARAADIAVVVVGSSHRDEGEFLFTQGGDRDSLELSERHTALVKAVAAANPRTVVVLVGGSAFITESWRDRVAAIVMAWYPGMEGGHAVADVLLGKVNPSGRLPCTWPRNVEQLPPFKRWARRIRYGPLQGYRRAIAEGHNPAFWFGFGLSYTSFEYGKVRAQSTTLRDGESAGTTVLVEVRNTGTRDGVETVQCYARESLGSDPRPFPVLRAVAQVAVPAGGVAEARLHVPGPGLALTVGPSSRPESQVAVPSTDPVPARGAHPPAA
jgi:beta-glucosidase